jgi:hypothetical protein
VQANLFFSFSFSSLMSVAVLLLSIVMAVVLSIRRHWDSFLLAEFTMEKMNRNLYLDIFSQLLTMIIAIFTGGKVGQWAGLQAGMWAGLLEGFAVGFLAAWVVRSLWGKVVGVLAK